MLKFIRKKKYLKYFTLIFLSMCVHSGISNAVQHEDIRSIKISGIELNIPRQFLIGSSAQKADSEDDAILFAFTYPEIKGGMGQGHDFIQVFCEDLREYFKRDGVTHSQHLIDEYWDNFLDIDKEKEVYKIFYKGIYEHLGRKHYRVKDYGYEIDIEKHLKSLREDHEISLEREKEIREETEKQNEDFRKRLNGEIKAHYKNVFTNDNPEAPEDYIICDKRSRNTRSFCESAFFYKDLFIELHFSRKSLKEYNNIKEQTLQLIKNWEN